MEWWTFIERLMHAAPDGGGGGAQDHGEQDDVPPDDIDQEQADLMAQVAGVEDGADELEEPGSEGEEPTGDSDEEPKEPEPKPTEDDQQASPEDGTEPGGEPDEDAILRQLLDKRVTIAGKEMSYRELLLSGQVEKDIQSARQLPTLQTKLLTLRGELDRAMGRTGPPAPTGAPEVEGAPREGEEQKQGPARDPVLGMTQEEFQNTFGGYAKQLAQAGYFGEGGELASDFPHIAMDLAFAKATYYPTMNLVSQVARAYGERIKALEDSILSERVDRRVDSVMPDFERVCAELSTKDEFFGDLATEEGRNKLLKLIVARDDGGADKMRDPKYLEDVWMESVPPVIRQALSRMAKDRKGAKKTGKQAASTDVQAGGPTDAGSNQLSEQQEEMRGLLRRVVAGSS